MAGSRGSSLQGRWHRVRIGAAMLGARRALLLVLAGLAPSCMGEKGRPPGVGAASATALAPQQGSGPRALVLEARLGVAADVGDASRADPEALRELVQPDVFLLPTVGCTGLVIGARHALTAAHCLRELAQPTHVPLKLVGGADVMGELAGSWRDVAWLVLSAEVPVRPKRTAQIEGVDYPDVVLVGLDRGEPARLVCGARVVEAEAVEGGVRHVQKGDSGAALVAWRDDGVPTVVGVQSARYSTVRLRFYPVPEGAMGRAFSDGVLARSRFKLLRGCE